MVSPILKPVLHAIQSASAMSSGPPIRQLSRCPSKVLRASAHFEVNWNTAAADRFAAAGVTLGVGAPLRIEAKTAAAGQELDPGGPGRRHEPLFHRKRPPLSTKQHLAAPFEP